MSTSVLSWPRVAISRLFLTVALALAITTAIYADSNVKKNFNLPAGDAATTLKAFADQSGEQILYPAEQVRGVQTNAVQGELTNRMALDAMLANTDLVIVQDKETGALVVRKSSLPDKNKPTTPIDRASPVPVKPEPLTDSKLAEDGETIVLSPFEVQGDTKGYYASSSLSGTRINSKLEDLAAPISVITKQQLTDTGALDINDVFKYEANTEGMYQYTDYTIDRSFYKETTTLTPQSANRIRGLNSANRTVNNFAVSSVLPLDSYNTDSIEISRGPNANIFGLGNASGTVNVNTVQANVTRDINEIIGRTDSYGQKRSNITLNRVLWKNHAAILFEGLYDDKGFVRQPAYETIKRMTVGVTLKPFQSTTIHSSFESYRNIYSRANTTLPRDSITEWMANGQPVWNPVTSSWRYLGSSTYSAPVTAANESSQLPLGLLPGGTGFWANPSVFIEPYGHAVFYGNNAAAANTTSPATPSSPVYRYVETGSIYRRGSDITKNPVTPLILFQPLSITDKSIYDYTSINFGSPNYGRDSVDNYQIELEQWLLKSQHNNLAVQLGYYNERVSSYSHSVFSDSNNAAPFLAVDVNEVLLDGTPNPFFLRPYIGGSQPQIGYSYERNGDARGALAYQFDLTDTSRWLKWLGHHNLVLYGERRDMRSGSYTSRDVNSTDYSWSSASELASIPVRGNTYRLYPRYYIGGPVTDPGSVVDYAPAGNFNHGNIPFTWYTSARTPVVQNADIEEVVVSGTPFKDREIVTQGATWQGFFWNDRIVTTAGWRYDRNRSRNANNINANAPGPTQPTSTIDPATRLNNLNLIAYFPNPWVQLNGRSHNEGIVFKAFPWLYLNYNQSDSFKPETVAYDINTNLLPNPTTKSKDYGFTLKLFDDKLVARVTRYETVEKNSRNGSITSAVVTRTLRMFFDPAQALAAPSATGVYPNGSSGDSFDLEQVAAQWYLQSWLQANPTATTIPTDVDAAAKLYAVNTFLVPLGIDQAFMDRVRSVGASNFTDVNTVTSTGTEIEVAYNPNRFWTLKLAGAQQKAVDSELGNAVTDFIASRWAAIHSIIVPTNSTTTSEGIAGRQWWLVGPTSVNPSSSTSIPSGFYVANVRSVVGLATANAGKPRPQTREYQFNATTNYSLAGIFNNEYLKRTSIGGSVRWASKSAVSYYGMAPSTDPEYKGAIIDYDPNRPIYDKARTYVDFKLAHDLHLWSDKVKCKIQLNINNVFENGHLQPIAYNPDGTAWGYRIVDPRQFILTVTFDL